LGGVNCGKEKGKESRVSRTFKAVNYHQDSNFQSSDLLVLATADSNNIPVKPFSSFQFLGSPIK
jgi:hypothetical protein